MDTRVRKHTTHPAGFAFVLLAALTGVGCSGVGIPQPVLEPMDVPDSWQESREVASDAGEPTAATLATWWQQLGDPVLDALVERTTSGNVDLETAGARVEEARARRGLNRAELGPSVSADFSAGRTEALGDRGLDTDSFSAGLTTVWEADLFGAKRLNLAASQAELEAEMETLHFVKVSLVAETVVAYADLRVAEARLRVLDESLASREETARLTDWREQAGLASRLEASQARSNLGQARAGRPASEQAITQARLRLDVLAGEVPGTLDELIGKGASQLAIPIPPDNVSIGIPAETLRQRPDVRSAERGLEAASARLGAAQAGRYPTLRLSGSLDSGSTDLDDLFDVDSLFANLLAGLAAPIFESGRISKNIEVREAQWQQAALAYRGTVLEALSEVERSLSAFRSSQDRIAGLEEAALAAAEAAELADQRYAAGLTDLLSVLDTERTLFSLEEQLVIAKGDLLIAFSNLYRALGGGWGCVAENCDAQDSDAQDSVAQRHAAQGGSDV